jgi:hypothetical protein
MNAVRWDVMDDLFGAQEGDRAIFLPTGHIIYVRSWRESPIRIIAVSTNVSRSAFRAAYALLGEVRVVSYICIFCRCVEVGYRSVVCDHCAAGIRIEGRRHAARLWCIGNLAGVNGDVAGMIAATYCALFFCGWPASLCFKRHAEQDKWNYSDTRMTGRLFSCLYMMKCM